MRPSAQAACPRTMESSGSPRAFVSSATAQGSRRLPKATATLRRNPLRFVLFTALRRKRRRYSVSVIFSKGSNRGCVPVSGRGWNSGCVVAFASLLNGHAS